MVYAGSGLRGYGNLVIIKHNNTFLTAYAHNQELLVREDQMVRQGQRIADMGFEAGVLERPLDVRELVDRQFIPAEIQPARIEMDAAAP